MALTLQISKKAVSKVRPRMWNITMNLVLLDDLVEVLNKDYSVKFRTGDVMKDKEIEFAKMMQADINKYKAEQNILTSTTFDNAVANVTAQLVV